MDRDLRRVLSYLREKSGLDFSGYRPSFVYRRVGRRLIATGTGDYGRYLRLLKEDPGELVNLADSLTIKVSRFFRDPLAFEYMARRLLPGLLMKKMDGSERSVRIWVAGCATGEEAYSIAILIRELLERDKADLAISIFATDIDREGLGKASEAVYSFESVKDVKYGLLKKYFSIEGEYFKLDSSLKKSVIFSRYDILDRESHSPPESVFSGFDMVFCRNLLIYFQSRQQELITGKLHRALDRDGYLVLGEAEIPSKSCRDLFHRVNECCHIYQKI